MKKWIIFLIVALLTGCSEPVSTAYKSASPEKQEKQRDQMDIKVHVYSLEQNNAGYIIKWDEREAGCRFLRENAGYGFCVGTERQQKQENACYQNR